VIKDGHIFCLRNDGYQCSVEGHEDLFQGSFANNNTIRLKGFMTVHDKNSLG